MPELSTQEQLKRRLRDRPRNRSTVGPVPTLGELQRDTPWVWVYCERRTCRHHAPMAIAPAVILWGPNASSNVLRQRARCSKCGHLGDAALTHPSWGGSGIGFAPFPTEEMNDAAEL
jgi:hypothetical protein